MDSRHENIQKILQTTIIHVMSCYKSQKLCCMRISIQKHKDKEINIKVDESSNVVRPIMHKSTDVRESYTILKIKGQD